MNRSSNYPAAAAQHPPSNSPLTRKQKSKTEIDLRYSLSAWLVLWDSGLHRSAAAITKRAVGYKVTKCCAAAILLPQA